MSDSTTVSSFSHEVEVYTKTAQTMRELATTLRSLNNERNGLLGAEVKIIRVDIVTGPGIHLEKEYRPTDKNGAAIIEMIRGNELETLDRKIADTLSMLRKLTGKNE